MASGKSDWTDEWQDRVADKDEPLEPRYVDIEIVFDDAMDMARTVVECTIEPLREMLAGLPAALDFNGWRSDRPWRRHRRWHRSWRGSASWDA
jgi:hypothetical protein